MYLDKIGRSYEAEMNAKMCLAWTCITPHKLAYSLFTCLFLLLPWIGPEVPSSQDLGWEEEGTGKKSLGVNCREKINKLLVKSFKLALRTANDHTKHTHTHKHSLYLLHVST